MTAEPERTCVGCRRRGPKGALIRIHRGPDGPGVDPTGAGPGRGAYLHPGCLDQGLGRLARALRVSLSPAELRALRAEMEREL